jgi:hypothetical protein
LDGRNNNLFGRSNFATRSRHERIERLAKKVWFQVKKKTYLDFSFAISVLDVPVTENIKKMFAKDMKNHFLYMIKFNLKVKY